jgi:hypothetical protein
MRTKAGIVAALVVGMAWLPLGAGGLESTGGAAGVGGAAASGAAPEAADSGLFANGTRAINESRWADAVKIFAQVAAARGEHADGALYWKAYAEDKLGQFKAAQDSCAELRGGYPKSGWAEDCGALEVEISSKTGKPVEIEPGQSDDVKLLALNAMMRQDEPRALKEIQTILNGDASETLKKEAQFILGQHYSNATYAQIVRISYVEGDVRVQRGVANEKTKGGSWEQAVANLPLEAGFSLVTGAGRAEIEFENASTIYLGENSVLTFNDLHTTSGIPSTDLGLLSGTASLYVHPYVAGERFILRTPTDDVVSKYPDRTYARIESYTDATAITPLEGGSLRLPGVARESVETGRTWIYRQGVPADAAGKPADEQLAAWDNWVSARVTARAAAISAVMEASGLTAPIPGLAEMYGQGVFFDCAPYGTCWEPKGLAGEPEDAARQQFTEPQMNQRPKLVLASFHPSASFGRVSADGQAAQANAAAVPYEYDRELLFPCTPDALRYRMVRDPSTGIVTVIDRRLVSAAPYEWAVCHAGSWVRHRRHYAWVVGGKRHHVEPVRWVKDGRHVGFIPLHPYDVKGQPALNAKHIVFEVIGKNDLRVEPVKFDSSHSVEFLNEPPKEFRDELMRPLARVEEPRMEARSLVNELGRKGGDLSRASIPIHFDARSLSFLVPREVARDGKTTTLLLPMTNRTGSLQSRAESFGGGSGFRGESSGGSRASFPGRDSVSNFQDRGGSSTSSGSTFHGGGSGSSSSGGFHGGGSGASSAASSASSSSSAGSSSAASSSSTGGGSHH